MQKSLNRNPSRPSHISDFSTWQHQKQWQTTAAYDICKQTRVNGSEQTQQKIIKLTKTPTYLKIFSDT
jgi:hypothetical protein